MSNRYVDQKKNTTGVRGLAAPGRVPPVQPCFVTENRAWRASRQSGRRQSGRRRSPPERCGRTHGDPWRAATPSWRAGPLHRPSRRVAKPLSSPRKTLFVSLQRTTYGPLRGRELGPGDWAHGPVRGREPASGGRANPRPLRLSPHRGEQEGSCGAGSLRFPIG